MFFHFCFTELQDGLKATDLSELKSKVLTLKNDLRDLSPKFSSNELQTHNSHIESLLMDIDLKLKDSGARISSVGKNVIKKPLDSIGSSHSTNDSDDTVKEGKLFKLSENLSNRRTKLQTDLENGANVQEIKNKAISLKNDLHKHAPDLSAYEIELHNTHVDKLLKDTDSKLKLSKTNQKVFEFAKKPVVRLQSIVKHADGIKNPTIDGKADYINQDLVLLDQNKVFNHLEKCTISSSDYNELAKSGSLMIQYMTDSVVSLNSLPFKNGSIFISDLLNCIILLHLPSEDRVQLRLHNLVHCKLMILCDDYVSSKQTVVIENFEKCIFHESCESNITIKSFNNVTQKLGENDETSEEDQGYEFGEFDTCIGNIQALKRIYIP